MNILGDIVDNNVLGNVKIQHIEQDFRTVYIEQDIYSGVNMVMDRIFLV